MRSVKLGTDLLAVIELLAARRAFWVLWAGYALSLALTWVVIYFLIRRLVKKAVRADDRVKIAELETSLSYERDMVKTLQAELAELYGRLRGVRNILDRSEDLPRLEEKK